MIAAIMSHLLEIKDFDSKYTLYNNRTKSDPLELIIESMQDTVDNIKSLLRSSFTPYRPKSV